MKGNLLYCRCVPPVEHSSAGQYSPDITTLISALRQAADPKLISDHQFFNALIASVFAPLPPNSHKLRTIKRIKLKKCS
jgi:hypothetical protein